LADASYPALSAQEVAHKAFMLEIAQLKSKVSGQEPDIAVIFEMKRSLIKYLIQHIKNLDRAYVEFLKGALDQGHSITEI